MKEFKIPKKKPECKPKVGASEVNGIISSTLVAESSSWTLQATRLSQLSKGKAIREKFTV
ncbi:MAG: hypothetical protein NDF56_01040 [archaeon GB-1845-036]|nr:hypothetical protein [Candidatus Culexmicrobium thermophilum]